MKKYIKNNLTEIINLFLILQPIIDVLTGIGINTFNMNVTIGIIIRILFLVFIMYITTFVYNKKTSKRYYIIFMIYSLLYVGTLYFYNQGPIIGQIKSLIKTFYFPIILISLYDLKDEFKIKKSTLFSSFMIYLILIIIPNIFGIGYNTYKDSKMGNIGFFNSANSISGIIAIMTPIMFIMFKELRNKKLIILYSIIYLIIILTIGTKTPLLAFLLTLLASTLYLFIKWIKNKNYKPVIYTSITLTIGILALSFLLPKTNFYKNIQMHLEYLKVDNVFEVFKDTELMDHFFLSHRITFLRDRNKIYKKAPISQKLLGIGYMKNQAPTKLVEMDCFDIFFNHGIIGGIIYFIIFLPIMFKIFTNIKECDYENYMEKFSCVLIIILNIVTGHIITSPDVSIYAIALMMLHFKYNKKDLLFCAVNLEIGGIEKSLVNLTNKIDKNKYNVTIILEENKGILLDKINDKVIVKEMKVSNNKNILLRKSINFLRKLIFNINDYHSYDFSCCYATYSLSANKIALQASKNTAIYVHSNYKYLYKNENEFRSFFDKRNISLFRKIIFVSNEAKDDFIRIYKDLKEKTIVFNNFIDIEEIKEKSLAKIKISKPKTKKLFVFIGRLDDSSKKVKRAINVIKEIENTELWIIGSGPDEQMYKNYVKDNNLNGHIKFLGSKENPYPYMKKADYIILTSEYEGFPVVYLEAIVLGKNIITTIPTSDDEINIGKDYAYIISKNQKTMIAEIEKILTEKSKLKTIDLIKIQNNRYKKLEKIFDEVV